VGSSPISHPKNPDVLSGFYFTIMNWQLFLVPLSSAFSCWLIIKTLFTILFRPQRPKSILGITIQGILPAKQSAIAANAGKLVAEQFFSMQVIEQRISDPAILQKVMPAIEEHIDDFLRNKLKKEMPFIGVFVGDKTITSLKKVFVTELETLFPNIMKNYAANLVADLNIEQLVSQKIESIAVTEVESLFRKKFSRELRLAQLISVGIGLLIGFIFMFIIIYIK